MAAAAPCPSCFEELPADAPGGLCPACLLRQILQENEGDSRPDGGTSTVDLDASEGGSAGTQVASDDFGILNADRDSCDQEPTRTVPPASDEVPSDSHPAGMTGQTIGPYRIVRPLGIGGMGAVFEARQEHPVRRTVALKIVRPGMDTDQVIARFEAERQALAMMEHPNIARVFDCGSTPDGQPYFVMELVDGLPITQFCEKQHLNFRQRLELLVPVCQALQHAHQKGVIHRDIKPSNVLVTTYDGRPVPKVIDFGLAKAIGQTLTANRDYTGLGTIVGTLRYMSPEQAGSGLDVDTRTDVYALGVLLYELLTGTTPLTPERLEQVALSEVLRVIREEEPPRPSKRLSQVKDSPASMSSLLATRPSRLESALRSELDWVVMKSLEKDRSRRYESASELAAELGRYLANEPVKARPPSGAYRLKKFARRHRAGVVVAGLTLIALTSLALVSTLFSLELSKSLRESNRRAAAFHFERGQAAFDKDEVGPGMLSMVESWRSAVAARDLAWQHTARAALSAWRRQYPRVHSVFSHAKAVRMVGFSPDGRTAFTASLDNTVRLWDIATGQPIGEPLLHRLHPNVVVFTTDCTRVLTGDQAGVAQFWDAATGKRSGPALLHAGPVRGLAISSDGTTILSTSGPERPPSELRHWDAVTGQCLAKTPSLAYFAGVAAFSCDGKKGFGFSTMMGSCTMDLATGRTEEEWIRDPSGVVTPIRRGPIFPGAIGFQDRMFAFSRDGGAALCCGVFQNLAAFRNLTAHEPVGSSDPRRGLLDDGETEHRGPIRALTLSPDGQIALTGSEDRTAQLRSTKTGRLLAAPLVHERAVNCVAFSPDGRTALTGSDDGTARLWDGATGERLGVPLVHQASVRDVAFSPDGALIFTGCEDGEARLWEPVIESRSGITLASASRSRALAVALSPDGELVLTGGEDGAVRLWDTRTGDPLGQPWAHAKPVHAVAFSPAGNTILVGTWMQALLYDAATATSHGAPLIHKGGFVRAVAFSPDGKFALTGSDDCSAWLWDTSTGQPVGMPMRHTKPVSAVAYGPDGRTVAIAADTDVRVFDAPSSVPPGRRLMHTGVVRALIYSPDGKTLLTRSGDADARLWDVATGEPRGEPLTRRGPVRSVAFNPTGNAVITGGADGRVQLWDAAGGQPLGEALEIKGSVRAVVYTLSDDRFGLDSHLEIKGSVRAVCFSPDGKTTIAAAEDGTARCWDTATWRRLGQPIPIPEKLASLQISASSKTLLAFGQEGSVRLWNVAELPDDLARVATWIEVLTGLTTDSQGSIKPLDHDAWQQRRALLSRLGGSP